MAVRIGEKRRPGCLIGEETLKRVESEFPMGSPTSQSKSLVGYLFRETLNPKQLLPFLVYREVRKLTS
jgi:hypothetical protein